MSRPSALSAFRRALARIGIGAPTAKSSALSQDDAVRNLTTFFEVSLDMLCVRDMDRKFVKVNQAWETALGYSVEELEGASMLDLIHPDDVADSQGHMERLQVEEEVWGFINRYRHKDGGHRHLEWRARRVGDLVFGVARDVTERLAIEAEMAAARHAVLQSQRDLRGASTAASMRRRRRLGGSGPATEAPRA